MIPNLKRALFEDENNNNIAFSARNLRHGNNKTHDVMLVNDVKMMCDFFIHSPKKMKKERILLNLVSTSKGIHI